MEDKSGVRDRLIQAGLAELEENGVGGLSLRKVAEKCGVSCAAPYKHFANKNELLRGMYTYVKESWYAKQMSILDEFGSDSKRAMIETCIQYVEFLTSNPVYLTLILAQDRSTKETFQEARTSITPVTKALYDRFCEENGVDELTKIRRIHAIRCIIYGSAVMFRNGDVPMTVEYVGVVKFNLERILTA